MVKIFLCLGGAGHLRLQCTLERTLFKIPNLFFLEVIHPLAIPKIIPNKNLPVSYLKYNIIFYLLSILLQHNNSYLTVNTYVTTKVGPRRVCRY